MNRIKLVVLMLATLITIGCASKTTTIDHSNGQAATAKIELPQFITALNVNNDEVTIPFMAGYPYYLSVAEGPVTLQFIYTQNWGRNSQNAKRIKTNILTIDFQAEAGKNYVLDYEKPSSISDPDNANYYIENFKAWIKNGETKIASAHNTGEKAKGVSLLAKQESQVTTDRLSELKRLWETANSEDRKEFMNWVITPAQ